MTGGRKGTGGGGRGERCRSTGALGKEEMEGEGSADPQLHPFIPHVPVSRSVAWPALQSGKERINTKINVFTPTGLKERGWIHMP